MDQEIKNASNGQNNNEVTNGEILEFLKEHMVMKEDFEERSGVVDKKFVKIDERFVKIDEKLVKLEEKMDNGFADLKLELEGIKQAIEKIDTRTLTDDNAMNAEIIKLKQRVEALEKKLYQLQPV